MIIDEKKVIEFLVKYRNLCNEYGFIIEGLWDEETCVAEQNFTILTYYPTSIPYAKTELCWEENIDNISSCWNMVPEKIED